MYVSNCSTADRNTLMSLLRFVGVWAGVRGNCNADEWIEKQRTRTDWYWHTVSGREQACVSLMWTRSVVFSCWLYEGYKFFQILIKFFLYFSVSLSYKNKLPKVEWSLFLFLFYFYQINIAINRPRPSMLGDNDCVNCADEAFCETGWKRLLFVCFSAAIQGLMLWRWPDLFLKKRRILHFVIAEYMLVNSLEYVLQCHDQKGRQWQAINYDDLQAPGR